MRRGRGVALGQLVGEGGGGVDVVVGENLDGENLAGEDLTFDIQVLKIVK